MRTIIFLAILIGPIIGGMIFAADDVRPAGSNPGAAFAVTISVDAAQPKGELKPIWRFFGCDEPNYACMKDGKKLLAELGQLPPSPNGGGAGGEGRIDNLPSPIGRGAVGEGNATSRAVIPHPNPLPMGEGRISAPTTCLTTGDGTPALKWGSTNAYTEDQQGRAVYDWTILDRIFDTYLERGVKPYVEIGFMPKALSIHPEPYQHRWTPTAKYDEIYTGWAYPPKDYAKWAELVYQWAKHCREKYGRGRSRSLVLGGVERSEHRLLARLARRFFQAPRLRRGCRAPGSAQRSRGRARYGRLRSKIFAGRFSNIACAARITPPERPARPWISCRFTPRASRALSTATCTWASPPS